VASLNVKDAPPPRRTSIVEHFARRNDKRCAVGSPGVKRVISAERRNFVLNDDITQVEASTKGIFLNGRNGGWNVKRRKSRAIVKSSSLNDDNVSELNLLQGRTSHERFFVYYLY
jgi:hypothetical protein